MGRLTGPITTAAARLLPLLLPLLLPIAACGGGERPPDGEAPAESPPADEETQEAIPVEVAPVRREALSSLYATSSTLRAEKRATVIARTKGVIRRLEVEEGDRVQTAQPLASLENEEQTIAFERARTTRDNKLRELERMTSLRSQELVSEEAFDTARREAEDAEHAAALAELELSRTVIRAPFSGVILTRHLDLGATVSDGTPVYDLADTTPLYADINVPERHVGRLEAGQTVRLEADASGLSVPARIERIAPAVDPASGTVKVTAAVEQATLLRPGAFVRVAIVTDTHLDALTVSRSALVAEGRRWHLFRLTEDGRTVAQLDVALGFEEGERVEIAAVLDDREPLQPGQKVVVVGAAALSDGSRVRIMEPGLAQPPASEVADADADQGSGR